MYLLQYGRGTSTAAFMENEASAGR